MKTTRLLATLIAIHLPVSLVAGVIQEEIEVKLGPKSFRDGDVILIDSVVSTSPRLEIGDTVTIKGRYQLSSQADGNLLLSLTSTQSSGASKVDRSQTTTMQRGEHEFELSITIRNVGFLHLSFYDLQTGKPFGGVYFGTRAQITEDIPVSVGPHGRQS